MSLLQIMLSGHFILAVIAYGLAILILLPLSARISNRLEHPLLLWHWDNIVTPLSEVVLLILFISLAFPEIFGIRQAPSIGRLLLGGELRINNLVNVLFLITLLFPLIPVFGKRRELILPFQGIAAVMMIFNWLAHELGMAQVSYWPGMQNVILIMVVARLSYWLAQRLAAFIGRRFDTYFNVVQSGALFARCLILFMQSPALLIYSVGLGKQIVSRIS